MNTKTMGYITLALLVIGIVVALLPRTIDEDGTKMRVIPKKKKDSESDSEISTSVVEEKATA